MVSSRLVVSTATAKGITATSIVVILFAANFTVTNAQQQEQQLTSSDSEWNII
jgi:hypothetical protein